LVRNQRLNSRRKSKAHPNWKLLSVIVGHSGWVRSLAVEPDNQWFASGSVDSTMKIWDLASRKLKLTLTGHIMAVRDIKISDRHTYMFSCSEDKTVKCWDLEKNKIIRDYHGHLSAVYSMDIHPTLDIIATGGRDASVRVWDIRSRIPIFVLTGHRSNVTNVKCRSTDPQIISTSMDGTTRLWDLKAGKTIKTLTYHQKSIRGFAVNPVDDTFVTASSGEIKHFKFPEGDFIQDFTPNHDSIINTLSVNGDDEILFSGGDDGSMCFYDWNSGTQFQKMQTTKMPGSIESESGIFTSCFDKTGLRLITGEADKTVKIWGPE
ncbi:mRNA splicing protein PRP46, partial [Ascoidea rubescens DSM 1968]